MASKLSGSAAARAARCGNASSRPLLFLAAVSSVLVTVGIVGVLLYESLDRSSPHVSARRASSPTRCGRRCSPIRATASCRCCSGTLLSTVVALALPAPLGLTAAIYLSEFASPQAREFIKPTLELLAGVPTVVYGFFALLFVTPLLQKIILPACPASTSCRAGIVIGIMIIPYVASLSEDAMRAVPQGLRDGSLRARRHQAGDGLRGSSCRRPSPASLPPSCSASRAPSARPWSSRSPPASSPTSRSIRASRRRRSPPTSCRWRWATCRTARIGYQSIFAAGLDAVSDDAGLQHLRLLAARQVPGGLLMTAIDHRCARPCRGRAARAAADGASC